MRSYTIVHRTGRLCTCSWHVCVLMIRVSCAVSRSKEVDLNDIKQEIKESCPKLILHGSKPFQALLFSYETDRSTGDGRVCEQPAASTLGDCKNIEKERSQGCSPGNRVSNKGFQQSVMTRLGCKRQSHALCPQDYATLAFLQEMSGRHCFKGASVKVGGSESNADMATH